MSIDNSNENTTFDIEIEKALLSAMLIKGSKSIPEVSSILSPEDF